MAVPVQMKAVVEERPLPSADAADPAEAPKETPSVATQCFVLNNMFDPATESEPDWPSDIADDVISECVKHGGCVHIYVDKESREGNVYAKCSTISTAVNAVNSLHGRYFSGAFRLASTNVECTLQ